MLNKRFDREQLSADIDDDQEFNMQTTAQGFINKLTRDSRMRSSRETFHIGGPSKSCKK